VLHCNAHGLAAREDGTCVICRRDERLPAATASDWTKWLQIAGSILLCALVIGALAVGARAYAARAEEIAAAVQSADANGVTIELYGASWCPVCRRAKSWLDKKGFRYVEYDVDEPAGRTRLQSMWKGRSIPVWKIDDQVFAGFSEERVAGAIAAASVARGKSGERRQGEEPR
jgi:glutaredoxin